MRKLIFNCFVVTLVLLAVFITLSLLLYFVKSTKSTEVTLNLPTQQITANKTLLANKQTENSTHWTKITIRPGDNLSTLLNQYKIDRPQFWSAIKQKGSILSRLQPGKVLSLLIDNTSHLQAIKYPFSLAKDLCIKYEHGSYVPHLVNKPITTNLAFRSIRIKHSLAQAIKSAGMPSSLYGQLVHIFQGSIDFSRNIHPGDHIAILYQQNYIDGKKLSTGNIMAAEFYTQDKTYKAIHFTYPKKHSGYYTPEGHGLEPLFLFIPVHYKRISSHFSYHRLDPITHRVQPHLGIDFAAKLGTPIHSIGDGKVIFKGYNAGYGNAIKIRYSKHYVAMYAHMHRFAKNIRVNQTVRKGQVIGFVGSTGWSTGPHLHFGFYVDGKPRDWLRVHPKKSRSIPSSYHQVFLAESRKLMDTLELYQATALAANTTKMSNEANQL